MKYSVHPFREAGLEAKWTKTRLQTPIIAVRDPDSKLKHQRERWWMIGEKDWPEFVRDGIRAVFERRTMRADLFSVEA